MAVPVVEVEKVFMENLNRVKGRFDIQILIKEFAATFKSRTQTDLPSRSPGFYYLNDYYRYIFEKYKKDEYEELINLIDELQQIGKLSLLSRKMLEQLLQRSFKDLNNIFLCIRTLREADKINLLDENFNTLIERNPKSEILVKNLAVFKKASETEYLNLSFDEMLKGPASKDTRSEEEIFKIRLGVALAVVLAGIGICIGLPPMLLPLIAAAAVIIYKFAGDEISKKNTHRKAETNLGQGQVLIQNIDHNTTRVQIIFSNSPATIELTKEAEDGYTVVDANTKTYKI